MDTRNKSGQSDAAGRPAPRGLYDPANEHDSCGVGFVARLDAAPHHHVVADAVQILINLEHRGAVGGDKATGDGAGLLLQMPDALLPEGLRGPRRAIAGGRGLRRRHDLPAGGRRCWPSGAPSAFEAAAREEGAEVLGWRDVPTSGGHLGELARSDAARSSGRSSWAAAMRATRFERQLYVIRRRAEKEVASWTDADTSPFYVASLSSRTIVYKGMLRGTQLVPFYPDLDDPTFATAFAVIHQRYSTNTFPTWSLAQPFRMLGHNGEINALRGNMNHMRAREADLASPLFGDDIEKLKPVLVEGGSDSAMFDNALELLVMAGRSLPHAAMMMVPEAWGPKFHMSDDKRAFYEYHAAIMEPWDGPAALVFTDGRYIGATLDRNGLRPCRYTLTRDGYVVLASETGVLDFAPERILRLRPPPAGQDAPGGPGAAPHRPGQRDQGEGQPPAAVPAVGQGQPDRAAGPVHAVRDSAAGPGCAPGSRSTRSGTPRRN